MSGEEEKKLLLLVDDNPSHIPVVPLPLTKFP
jgi:hypothetical protein